MPRTLAAGPMPETDRCRPSLSFPASSVAAEEGDLLSSTRGSREAASRTWLAPSVPARESPRVPPNNLKRKPGDLFKAQARAPESMVRPHPWIRGTFQSRANPDEGERGTRESRRSTPPMYACEIVLPGETACANPGFPLSFRRPVRRNRPVPDTPIPRIPGSLFPLLGDKDGDWGLSGREETPNPGIQDGRLAWIRGLKDKWAVGRSLECWVDLKMFE